MCSWYFLLTLAGIGHCWPFFLEENFLSELNESALKCFFGGFLRNRSGSIICWCMGSGRCFKRETWGYSCLTWWLGILNQIFLQLAFWLQEVHPVSAPPLISFTMAHATLIFSLATASPNGWWAIDSPVGWMPLGQINMLPMCFLKGKGYNIMQHIILRDINMSQW